MTEEKVEVKNDDGEVIATYTKKPHIQTEHEKMKERIKVLSEPFSQDDLRWYYFPIFLNNGKMGHITVVTYVDRETNEIEMAFSFCSPKDEYDKIVGKDIAICRLMSCADEETGKKDMVVVSQWLGHSLPSIAHAINNLENKPKWLKDIKMHLDYNVRFMSPQDYLNEGQEVADVW